MSDATRQSGPIDEELMDELRDERFDDLLTSGEIDQALQSGRISAPQADALLQQAARRQTADEGPTLDTDADGTITTGGFGSGQGMEKARTGQPPR